ncbi:MAG: hypothetical protein Q3962_06370, partial [Corynebacterium sp.]|nr:hypothetical protein [Corynebacterium sp.]
MLNSRKARRIGGAFVTGALALTSTTVVVSQAFAADIDQARTEAVTELKTTDYLTEAQQGLLQDAANQQEDENSLNSWADGIKTLAANQKALKALLDEATTVKASDAYTNATQENKTAYDQAVTGGQAVKMDSLTADSNLESATKALQAAKDALTASTESSSPESSSP